MRNGLVRIQSRAQHVRRQLNLWQRRHPSAGAVHISDPATLLLSADTPIDALEDLLLRLEPNEVEIIWRDPELFPQA